MGMSHVASPSGFDRVDDLDEARRLLPELRLALDQLTPVSAEAVKLRIVEGWSYDDLARHLGCTPATARVRVSRALTTLHRHLDPNMNRRNS
jgi:RNA polymerase sigma factor (sigma-70 family)